jgi:hypothetical protein
MDFEFGELLMETKTHTVHFSVDYDGLTQMVRDFWAEGSYTLATAIMTDSNIPIDYAHDVIRGKMKMVQDPNDPDGGMLTEDNWQPNNAVCYMGKYPDPLDYKWFKLVNRYGTEGLSELRQLAEWAVNAMNNSTYSLDKIRILQEVKRVPEEIYEYFNIPDPKTIHTSDLHPAKSLDAFDYSRNEAASDLRYERLSPELPHMPVAGLPDVDTFIKRQLELDKMPKPKPDKNFSRPCGYIIPTGKFYSCEWMEHDWLASVLGNSQHFDKEIASNMGWIEITHPMGEPENLNIIMGDKEPTQKQLDTLFDWQQKYGEGEIIKPSGEW